MWSPRTPEVRERWKEGWSGSGAREADGVMGWSVSPLAGVPARGVSAEWR